MTSAHGPVGHRLQRARVGSTHHIHRPAVRWRRPAHQRSKPQQLGHHHMGRHVNPDRQHSVSGALWSAIGNLRPKGHYIVSMPAGAGGPTLLVRRDGPALPVQGYQRRRDQRHHGLDGDGCVGRDDTREQGQVHWDSRFVYWPG